MLWSLNSIGLTVQKYTGEVKQIVAKLQPLSGGTVFQFFGYETNIVKLTAKIVGESNKDNLKNLTTTGTSYSLVSPEGVVGDFFVSSVTEDRNMCISQTIDISQACDAPVYDVQIELYEEV
jgi:hypothetical protein